MVFLFLIALGKNCLKIQRGCCFRGNALGTLRGYIGYFPFRYFSFFRNQALAGSSYNFKLA
jgi:hypothetical protein